MDCNCGRFFNTKSPAKPLKLYSPISIDSNDSQFNMWNDFDFQFHKKNDLKQSRKAPDNAINDARFANNNKGELGWAKTRPLSISSPY